MPRNGSSGTSNLQRFIDVPDIVDRRISVNKAMPQGTWNCNHPHLSEEVLIANSCAIEVGYYNRERGQWQVGAPIDGEWIDKITHWMPLPQNPHDVA